MLTIRPLIDRLAEKLRPIWQPLRRFLAVLTRRFSGTILVVIGFAWGAFLLLHDIYRDVDYLKSPPFQLYFLAVIAQTVFWAVALGSIWPALKELWLLAKDYKLEVTLWSLLFVTLMLSSRYFAVDCPAYSLPKHSGKTDWLTYTGGFVAITAGIGSILVNIGLRNLLNNGSQASIEQDKQLDEREKKLKREKRDARLVNRYLQLRGYLLHFLSVLGVMLGLVAVAQSAKRYLIMGSQATAHATKECHSLSADVINKCIELGYYCKVPFELKRVYIYGLYYTVILVLTFLPTFSTLIATGHKLRDDILPVSSPNSDSWSSDCAKRAELEKLLAISMSEGLRAIIAILAPIIGSLVSLVGFLKDSLVK